MYLGKGDQHAKLEMLETCKRCLSRTLCSNLIPSNEGSPIFQKAQSDLYRFTYLLKFCNVFRRVSAPCWSESAPRDGCLLFSDSQIDSFVEIVPKVSKTLITNTDTRICYSRRENRNATCNLSIIDKMHSVAEPLSIEKSVRRNRAVVQCVSR